MCHMGPYFTIGVVVPAALKFEKAWAIMMHDVTSSLRLTPSVFDTVKWGKKNGEHPSQTNVPAGRQFFTG